jgi:hypothetical protein
MRIPKRDIIATGLVVAAGFVYLLLVVDAAPPAIDGTRATGLVVLGRGFAASASAVGPDFDDLIHDNKVYLAVTSMIGPGAFGAGVQVLLSASEEVRACGAVRSNPPPELIVDQDRHEPPRSVQARGGGWAKSPCRPVSGRRCHAGLLASVRPR